MRKQYLAICCLIFGTIFSSSATSIWAAPFAYVANDLSANVSVIDLATNAVTATIATGLFPTGSAVNQIRSLVYITNADSRTVSVISVATNSVVATVPLAAKPFGIALNPAGTRAFVTHDDGTVSVIDTLTNSVIANFLVGTPALSGINSLWGIVVDSSGRFAYLADSSPRMVRVIDLINFKVVANIDLTGHPYAVAIHPAGRYVYVTTQIANVNGVTDGVRTLSVIDTATNAVVAAINTGGLTPYGVAVNPAGTSVYVVTSSGALVISTVTNTAVGNVALVPASYYAVGFHPDGSRAYVTNQSGNTVLAIDTSSLSAFAAIPVGRAPGSLGDFIVACAAGQVFIAGNCAAPDDRIVEYINTLDFPLSPGGHFFYTNDAGEQASLDAGGAGRFSRTGNSFKPGGTKQLCRFYGSVVPGPNSHFFTINDAECDALKAAQVIPPPSSVQQWNYEGLIFSETPPIVGGGGVLSCPPATVPVYRYYNNAFRAGVKNPWDSNHRYGTNKSGLDTFATANSWAGEGIVFCAPP